MTTTSGGTVAKRPTLAQKNVKLAETLEAVQLNEARLAEALSNAVMLLKQEDAGWALPGYTGRYKGLSLDELQGWSDQIRASLGGTENKAPNPHMRNGFMLRHSFVWDGGIHYGTVPGAGAEGGTNAPTRGKTNVQGIIDNTENQRLFFGTSARRKREHALYADGLYLVVGENSSKKLRPVPLADITDFQSADYYEDEIVAYRWTRNVAQRAAGRGGAPGPLTGNRELESVWVYVDWYDGKIPDTINYHGKSEKVLKNHTAFDLHANRPEGAAFGSPDAISALVWARIIRDLIMNGVKMQDALAMFAFKATAPTKKGQETAALELAGPVAAGSAATLAGNSDFNTLSSAGKGYDFASIGFIVSTMAASLHVSGIALSANTALAGSSYGAAKTLDLPGRMAMETRRAEHIEFDNRILTWLGAPKVDIYFDTYEDATDEYRAVQAAMLAWTTGTLTPEGFREELELIYGRKLAGAIPKGVIIPNNQKQIDDALKAQQEAAAAAAAAKAEATPSTASPQQGKSTGAGGSDKKVSPAPKAK